MSEHLPLFFLKWLQIFSRWLLYYFLKAWLCLNMWISLWLWCVVALFTCFIYSHLFLLLQQCSLNIFNDEAEINRSPYQKNLAPLEDSLPLSIRPLPDLHWKWSSLLLLGYLWASFLTLLLNSDLDQLPFTLPLDLVLCFYVYVFLHSLWGIISYVGRLFLSLPARQLSFAFGTKVLEFIIAHVALTLSLAPYTWNICLWLILYCHLLILPCFSTIYCLFLLIHSHLFTPAIAWSPSLEMNYLFNVICGFPCL